MQNFIWLLFFGSIWGSIWQNDLVAAVIRYDINLSQRQQYSLSEVCTKIQAQHIILPEVLNSSTVSCGVQSIKALDFCLQWRSSDALLIRAFADRQAKVIKCDYGSRVMFSYSCENLDDPTCQSSGQSCRKLKSTIAYELELVHHGVSEQHGKPLLNCFFDRPLEFTENSFLLQKNLSNQD